MCYQGGIIVWVRIGDYVARKLMLFKNFALQHYHGRFSGIFQGQQFVSGGKVGADEQQLLRHFARMDQRHKHELMSMANCYDAKSETTRREAEASADQGNQIVLRLIHGGKLTTSSPDPEPQHLAAV